MPIGTLNGTFGTGNPASGSAFTYSEVGYFRFAPYGVYDDGSFADVDRSQAGPRVFRQYQSGQRDRAD
ncbi:hypothetical protein LP420_01390 [Massilia sp. B-10]|nr:hypothetical protein LP420_01390 [Massilia sp. B-10]